MSAHGGRPAGPSIRLRVLVGVLLVMSAAITGAGFAVEGVVRARLRATHAASLEAVLEAGALRACAEARRAHAPWRPEDEREWSLAEGDASGHLWLVRRPGDERPLAVSDGFPLAAAPAGAPHAERTTAVDVAEHRGDGGEPFRVARFTVYPLDLVPDRGEEPPRGEGPGRDEGLGPPRGRPGPRGGPGANFREGEHYEVHVAAPIAAEVATLSALRGTLVGVGGGALVLAAVLMALVVRRGMAPLGELSRRVADLDEGSLERPIHLAGAPAELAPIVTALDASRARLARAFERERRFTADAAHELRTPIAGLRANLEVALRRPRTVDEHRELATRCLDVARSMEDTLEGLLMLARAEELGERLEPVDLAAALRGAFSAEQATLEARGSRVRDETADGTNTTVLAVPALVERIASNLARNAAAHGAAGGDVVHAVEREPDGRTVMRVTNACAALPPETAARATEPFWRADAARTGDGAHAGLGLALVAKAAEALGGRATVEVEDQDRRSVFTVRVAIAGPPPQPPM